MKFLGFSKPLHINDADDEAPSLFLPHGSFVVPGHAKDRILYAFLYKKQFYSEDFLRQGSCDNRGLSRIQFP
jgi:hypothetical protein